MGVIGSDKYNLALLRQMYNLHRTYVANRANLAQLYGVSIRSSGLPEDLSENMIKFIISTRSTNKSMSDVTWNCSGDLYSPTNGKLECKCFTSDGPISFSPKPDWNSIYFLDATQWLNNRFVLYHTNLRGSSEIWKQIMINRTNNFNDLSVLGRRPRLTWCKLYPQIKDCTSVEFDGSFDDIVDTYNKLMH